jgi:hypothetical protein
LIRSVRLLVLLGVCGLAAGCGVSTNTVAGPDGAPRSVSEFKTALAPKDALRRATNVLQRLEIRRVNPPGYTAPGSGGFFGTSEPKDWPIKSDAFSGVAYGRTAANESIDLAASWAGKDKTIVKVTTQLAAAQHKRLVDEIEAEVNIAAK